MLRKRNLPQTPEADGRKAIADFLGLEEKDVVPQVQPQTFGVTIGANKAAQDKYKEINQYGTEASGGYDFDKVLLVRWDFSGKVKPC